MQMFCVYWEWSGAGCTNQMLVNYLSLPRGLNLTERGGGEVLYHFNVNQIDFNFIQLVKFNYFHNKDD